MSECFLNSAQKDTTKTILDALERSLFITHSRFGGATVASYSQGPNPKCSLFVYRLKAKKKFFFFFFTILKSSLKRICDRDHRLYLAHKTLRYLRHGPS